MSKPDSSHGSDTPGFLTVDARVPAPIRDLLNEADGCVKNAFLIGGTACAQRVIQILLTAERVEGADLEARIRALAEKHPSVPQMLTTVLQKFGETAMRDGAKLSAGGLNLLIVTLKAIVYEIYVLGPERVERLEYVRKVVDSMERKQSDKRGAAAAAESPAPVAASA
jgi:hypothetical protein